MVDKKENEPFSLRFLHAQQKLVAPKNEYNSFGKYDYRTAEGLLKKIKPINRQYGLMLTIADEIVEVGGRVYVKATATVYDADDMTHSLSATAYAREAESRKGMDDSQITGAASSYARKYALAGLYAVDDRTDADGIGDDGSKRSDKPQTKADNQSAKQNKKHSAREVDQLVEHLVKIDNDMNQHPGDCQKWVEKQIGGKINTRTYEQARDKYVELRQIADKRLATA